MTERPPASTRGPEIAFSWWAIASLVVLFAALGYIAHGWNTLRIDLSISARVQSFDGQLAEPIAWFGNWLGERSLAIVLLAMAWLGLALLKQRRDLWFVALVATGRLIANPLKSWFDSPRPSAAEVEIARVYDGLGYPSGHAMTSAVVVGAAAIIVARRTQGRVARWLLWGCWFVGMTMTAFARIWYGAHWFTDSLGGAIVGIAIVVVAANLSETIVREAPDARPAPPRQTPGP